MANPNLPGVAYFAHISGFVIGAIAMLLISRLSKDSKN
jgi:membrane associated rhomboid family serine protease